MINVFRTQWGDGPGIMRLVATYPDEHISGQALTRRDALTGLLRVGGGLLAAGTIACDPSSAERAATVRASIRAGTRPPNISPATTGTSSPPADLRLNILPSALTIHRVWLDVPVKPAAVTGRGIIARPEIVVPNYGVVSPNLNLGRNSVNNIWILGHSH